MRNLCQGQVTFEGSRRRILVATVVSLVLSLSCVIGSQAADDREAKLAAWKTDIAKKEKEIAERFVAAPPKGEYYEATVPDTLDLAERGALALNSLTGMLDPSHDYDMYVTMNFAANPPYMSHMGGTNEADCWSGYLVVGKVVESLPLMRLMSGSKQDLDIERGLMLSLMAMSWDNGLLYTPPAGGRPWWRSDFPEVAMVPMIGRVLLGMLYWHQYDGNPLWMEQSRKIYRTLRDTILHYEGDYAYFPELMRSWGYYPKGGYPDEPSKKMASGGHQHGGLGALNLGFNLRGVAKYAEITGDRDALELARKMANTLRRPEFWIDAKAQQAGMVGSERGQYTGHIHSYVPALRGLLDYARLANDTDLKQFVRQGYEYTRNFGIPEIGWFPAAIGGPFLETCSAVDVMMLAVELSQDGVGDYWDDVDRYARNELAELQLTDKEQLAKASTCAPPRKVSRPAETDDRAIERSLGSFAANPRVTDYPNPWGYCCCNNNGAQALYHVWESIIQDKGNGIAQINLLLNRASPQIDVDSYLPYEGKVIIHNKTARKLRVRIPNWVSKPEVRCRMGTTSLQTEWLNNYLLIERSEPGADVTIEFPVVEQTIRKTEGVSGKTYTIRLRGNTVVDISPRDEDAPVAVSAGKLVVPGPVLLTVPVVKESDVNVSVDAKSNSTAGILLRYKSDWDYLLALYRSQEKSIRFYEMTGGLLVPSESAALAADITGPDIHLNARVQGLQASLTVSDGSKTFSLSYSVKNINGAGAAGLYGPAGIDERTTSPLPAQNYDNFRVTASDGKLLFEDRFDAPDGPPKGWQGAKTDVNYYFYRRNHMRASKAPMKGKVQFVPARVIAP